MSSTVFVRLAREPDLDGIAHVLAAAFEEHQRFAAYCAEVAAVRERAGDGEIFVAVTGEAIVGAGALYPPGRGDVYAGTMSGRPWPVRWASLRFLGVHPAHRRRGIGAMLLDARVARARELQASAVALHTSREFGVAHRLVQRRGWRRVPGYDRTPLPGVSAEAYVLTL